MKKYFLLLLLPLFALFSCNNDDGYSLDEWTSAIATVDNPGKNGVFYLDTDQGERLWTAATDLPYYKPETGQRVIAYYTILSDGKEGGGYNHDIKLLNIYEILTKKIFTITPATQDSIGNDIIAIKDMSIGRDFLNIDFQYRGYDKKHMLNLVRDPLKVYTDGKVHLEFRHNAYNDPKDRELRGLASFNLLSLKPQPSDNTVTFLDLVIHVKDSETTEKTYEIKYNFNSLVGKKEAPDPSLFNAKDNVN